ncbi:hypothetical protein BKA62DRAFT_720779 [Auriculariales sp. MPI-PUGE-AT-0066]|nr:hypothetical protein BKA62DRAFT_720779 [Auriculariales sp. MPI-PUGE-AT-0066]
MPPWPMRLVLPFLITLLLTFVDASIIPLHRSSLSIAQTRQRQGQQYATDEKGGLWTLEAGSGEASVVTRNDDKLRQVCPSQSSSSNGAIFYLRGGRSNDTWAWASVPSTADFRISLALSSSRQSPTVQFLVVWNSGSDSKGRTFSGTTQCDIVLDRDFFRSGIVPSGATLDSIGIQPTNGDSLFAFNVVQGPFATTPSPSANTTTPADPDPTQSSSPSTQDAPDATTTHPLGSDATSNVSHLHSSSTSASTPVQSSGAQQASGSTSLSPGSKDSTGASGSSDDGGNQPNATPSGSGGVSIAAIVAPVLLVAIIAALVLYWCRMRRRRAARAAKVHAVAEPFMTAPSERGLPPSAAGGTDRTVPTFISSSFPDSVLDEKSVLTQQEHLRDGLPDESHPPSTRGPMSTWDASSSVGGPLRSDSGAGTVSSDVRGVNEFRQGEVSAELYHAMQRVGFSPQSLLHMLNGVSDDSVQDGLRRKEVLASPPAYGSS